MRDVVVIGAGPAGSAAALLLVRAGWHVTLVEQHRFPRDKVCGECLSALGIEVLERLGLAGQVQRVHPPALVQVVLHAMRGQSLRLSLPRPLWGISRSVLDQFLSEAARDAGAVIRQPSRCEAIGTDPMLAVRIRDLGNNLVQELRPSYVLVADGQGMGLAPRPTPRGDFGIRAHFVDVEGPRNTVELFAGPGQYAGLAPVEGGRWNLACRVAASRVESSHGDLSRLLAAMTAENRALGQCLGGARRVSAWLACPLRQGALSCPWPPGIVAIGNAAAAIEPIGGEGMGLALRSAELATEALEQAEATASAAPLRHLRRQFRAFWRPRALACRMAGMAMASSWLAPLAMQWLELQESTTRDLLKWIGKDAAGVAREPSGWLR